MFGGFTALKVLEDKSLDKFVEMMKKVACR